ncbi:Uncharacterised protein [Halioglobus japonicus]|nr:Uncharacterised protein [Halioglobus japonicus]
MKVATLIIVLLITSCASLEENSYLVPIDSPGWDLQSDRFGAKSFSHACNDEDFLVTVNDLISSDGKAYFVLFVVPIHSNSHRDQNGLFLRYGYSTSDISEEAGHPRVVLNGKEIASPEIDCLHDKWHWCQGGWPMPNRDEGSLAIEFPVLERCEVSPLRFKYMTGTEYQYDSICC